MHICFLTPMHPSRNPRLVRSAGALVAAGHQVTVAHPRYQPEFEALDSELARAGGWANRPVETYGSAFARLRWQYLRLRHKVGRQLAPLGLWSGFDDWAASYFTPQLARLAVASRADLLIAQQHHTVPAAARAARQLGRPFAIDVEDLLSDSDSEPREAMRRIEQRLFARAAFFYSMSEVAVERTRELSGSTAPAFVLHNCPRLAERDGILPPAQRPARALPMIYWFGQTLGPHSCAETLLRGIAAAGLPVGLALRGTAQPDYVAHLRSLAAEFGIGGRLEILERAHPDRMVALSAEHEIALGSQPSEQLFHQLAIGNKVFTGLMAGCALLLTDTIAHRRLQTQLEGACELYPERKPSELGRVLQRLLGDPTRLQSMRARAWDLGGSDFHWAAEAPRLLAAVDKALADANPSALRS